jgi:hypothetical protein
VIGLTAEQEALVAALDINDSNGGLDFREFRNYGDPYVRDVFRHRHLIYARQVRAAQEAKVAEWVNALTDDQVLAVITGIGRPFDASMYSAAICNAANKALGLKYVDEPKNTAARLEKLVTAGKLNRVKNDEYSKRWSPQHTGCGVFNSNQWVYFTAEVAAALDVLQQLGTQEVTDRSERFRAAWRTITDAGVSIDVRYRDHPVQRQAEVTMLLDDFELLAEALKAKS